MPDTSLYSKELAEIEVSLKYKRAKKKNFKEEPLPEGVFNDEEFRPLPSVYVSYAERLKLSKKNDKLILKKYGVKSKALTPVKVISQKPA